MTTRSSKSVGVFAALVLILVPAPLPAARPQSAISASTQPSLADVLEEVTPYPSEQGRRTCAIARGNLAEWRSTKAKWTTWFWRWYG
ncbi:hypothetical protein AC244_33265 [Ensifer adhaerens]|uniref:Secreted protein n=1 Tax=Ensifer adhaerens TaxID=106592 RepID=A0A0L8BDC0_ENSAD|nr:hypothetical protein AC244_33265 [Ensifer adhaerens]